MGTNHAGGGSPRDAPTSSPSRTCERWPTPSRTPTGTTTPTSPTPTRRWCTWSRATSAWWAAATRACGRPSSPRSATRPRTSCCWRARPSDGAHRDATAASWSRASPTVWPTARSASPPSWPRSSRWASRPSTTSRPRSRTTRSTATTSAPGVVDIATEPHQLVELAERVRAALLARPGRGAARRGRHARRGRLPHLPRRVVAQGASRTRRPGPPGLGPQGRGRDARRADLRAHQGHQARARRHRRPRAHPLRQGPGRAGGARHQRLPSAAAPHEALHRPGLRLRDGHRAPEPRAPRQRRVGQPPGALRLRQPVPLLPAHRGQPDPVGRLRRGLLLRRQGRSGPRVAARDLRPAVAALLHGLPPARGRRVHQRLGRRHRHLHPLLRLLGHGHARQGRLRRGLHRASACARRASGPRCSSTCSRAAGPSAPRWSSSARSRCRSRRSRSSSPASS